MMIEHLSQKTHSKVENHMGNHRETGDYRHVKGLGLVCCDKKITEKMPCFMAPESCPKP